MTKQLERTTQTKDALIYAFWELYQTTPIEKITVKSITDRAGYYRSTFYCYFTDVYQVLEDIEQNILNELNYILIQMDPKEIYSDTLRAQLYFDTHNELFLNLMVQFYEKNSTYLLLLFSAKGDPSFVEKFKNTVRKYFFPDNALAELPRKHFLFSSIPFLLLYRF